VHIGWFHTSGDVPSPPRSRSTQQAKLFLEGIQDGVIDLGGGAYRRVLEVSARNLDLASVEEQAQIIARFRAFLNGLSFPIQILVRIEPLNVEGYLTLLDERVHPTTEASLRELALAQRAFVRELAAARLLLSRRFFVVIPAAMPARAHRDAAWSWLGLGHRSSPPLPTRAIASRQLAQRTTDVIRGLETVGLHARPLNTEEVLALYYAAFCPTQSRLQPLRQSVVAATTPAVRRSLEAACADRGGP
jgi:hypothetical protein